MGMELVWVKAEIENSSYVDELRDSLGYMLPDMSYKPEENPHITILPGFGFRDESIPYGINHLEYATQNSSLIGHSFAVNGVEWYPSPERPMVLMLNITLDLSYERDRLVDIIDRYDSEHIHTPVDSHITLYNALNDSDWNDVSDKTVQKTQDLVDACCGSDQWTETVSDIVVETWGR